MEPDLRDLLRVWTGDVSAEAADGTSVSEARAAALLARLRSDAAFRAAFVAEIRLLGQLHAVQSPEPRWLRLEDELAAEAVTAPAFEDRVLDRLAEPSRPRSRRAWLLPAAVAASLAAGLVVGLSVAPRDRGDPTGPTAPREVVAVPTKPGKPAEAVAVIVKADGAKWDAAKPFDEGALVPAGRHKLTAGRVTLTLFNGVVMSVQGPADLDLTDPARLFCHRGKVRARTSPDAEQFAVLAPGAAVVDLGTEFAVTVADDGKVDAMVFEGKAEVSLLNTDGDSVRSELLEGRKAVQVDAGRIREVPAVAANFAPAPELVAPSLRLDPAYRETVLKSRPWGYWRYDETKAGGIPNEVPNRPQLRPTGTIPLVGDGNRVAEFDAPKVEKHFVMDGSWTPPRGNGYAVELWVMPRELNVGSLVALTARVTEPAQKHIAMLELVGKEHHLIHEPGAVRFLERWPAAHAGGVNVFSRRMYVPYRWHHIVARRTTDRMEIYLNGELAGTSSIDPADETTPCRLMVGRMKHGKQPGPDQERPFVGRLDELAVYDHPLSPEDIRRHFELGNVPGFGGK